MLKVLKTSFFSTVDYFGKKINTKPQKLTNPAKNC